MKGYKERQLARLGAVIIILFLIAGLINAASIFYGSMHRFRLRQKEAVKRVLEDFTGSIHFYNTSYLWFMDFWHKHYKDMDFEEFSLQEMMQIAMSISDEKGYSVPELMPAEVLENLTYDEQLTLAEFVYSVDSNHYNIDFSDYGMEVSSVIRFLIPEENNEAFIVFETDSDYVGNHDTKSIWDDDADRPEYRLGKRISFNLNDHPHAKEAIVTGKDQLNPEDSYSIMDKKMVSNYYVPVKNDGNVVALIMLSVDWSANLRVIWQNVWQVELINLIVLGFVGAVILFLVKMLTDRVTLLSGEQERKNTELSIARDIQQQNLPNVFPAFPDRYDFDIYASMESFSEVGGDFYDYFLIDDDHLALVIADVSGKGVPAALFMMMAKTRLNSLALSEKSHSPSRILEKANHSLCENNDSAMFVTVWLGILTLSSGELVTANGGHLDPFISTEGDFLICKEEHGMPLGLMEDHEYADNKWQLGKGDTVFVCTDGAIEAMDAEEKEFGNERLLEVLNKNKDKSLSDILTAVKTDIEGFSGEKGCFDDITMLVVRLT